jgi:IclR family transcriptional regulator, KDG regulon repressor
VSLTVDKAIRILELLGDGELRLTDLSSKLGEHKSTVQRLLSTLQARGFVRQNGDNKRYSLGLKVLQLASATLANMDQREAAREPAVMAAARQISDNLGSKREEGREEPA